MNFHSSVEKTKSVPMKGWMLNDYNLHKILLSISTYLQLVRKESESLGWPQFTL